MTEEGKGESIMKPYRKGCDGCGEDRNLRLYPTDNGVIELCRQCAKEAKRIWRGC